MSHRRMSTFMPVSFLLSTALFLSVMLGLPLNADWPHRDIFYARAEAATVTGVAPLSFAVISPVAGVSRFETPRVSATVTTTRKKAFSLNPAHLSIPSVAIDSPIRPVGVNAKGEMDVPSGDTDNVGWYMYGAKPGEKGIAVIDAHVFAAFSDLDKVKPGADIYIRTDDSTRLHFRVSKVATYKLSQLTPSMLFKKGSAKGLNLITCAGTYIPSAGTYDHRLIVYTEYVGLA